MSENNLFPRKSDIFKKSVKDVQSIIGRPSLDTLYQVTFSFGNYETWLQSDVTTSTRRTSGLPFQQKMSIMCTEAEIPGTTFQTSLAVGHHQGIQEEFPNLRSFPPLNLTFYVDAEHVILEVLESWMTFINPITNNKRNLNAYGRFNYPEDYKEVIHLTKFERDTFIDEPDSNYRDGSVSPTTKMLSYEFVNVWPTNLTSMRVAYGDSNVLRCSVQLAYDRFFTEFNYSDTNQAVEGTAWDLLNNKEQSARNSLRESYMYGNTWPENGASNENQRANYEKQQQLKNWPWWKPKPRTKFHNRGR